jgi:DNA-binding NtrC family response regulator
MDFLRQLFGSGDFMPHGYCYMWNPGLVWLHRDFRRADCALSNLGYDVILAYDGEQAIREFREHGDRIDLLLDVVLPKINGPEAYARMIAERPDVPAIFATD